MMPGDAAAAVISGHSGTSGHSGGQNSTEPKAAETAGKTKAKPEEYVSSAKYEKMKGHYENTVKDLKASKDRALQRMGAGGSAVPAPWPKPAESCDIEGGAFGY